MYLNADNTGFDKSLPPTGQEEQEKGANSLWSGGWPPPATPMTRSRLEASTNALPHAGIGPNNPPNLSTEPVMMFNWGSNIAQSLPNWPESMISLFDEGYETQEYPDLDYGLASASLSAMYDTKLPPPIPCSMYKEPQNFQPLLSPRLHSTKRSKISCRNSVKCSIPGCGVTFKRMGEFRRHFNGAHAAEHEKRIFWCPVAGCARSEMQGGRAFPRKDKVGSHLRQAHRMSYQVARMLLHRRRS